MNLNSEDLTKLLQLVLPLMLIGNPGLYQLLSVVLIFFLPSLVEYLKRFRACKQYSLAVMEYRKYWYNNDTYSHISAYLVNAGTICELITDECTKLEAVPNTTLHHSKPIIKPSDGSSIIKLGKNHITVYGSTKTVYNGDKSITVPCYIVKCPSMEGINEFLRVCQEHYIGHIIKTEHNMYKIFHFIDKEWHSSNIAVEKTPENVILPKDRKEMLFTALDQFKSSRFTSVNLKLGLANKCTFFFTGSPGSGKTSTTLMIAKYMNMPIYTVPPLNDVSCALLTSILFSIPSRNVVILFDDIDCCTDLHDRSSSPLESKDQGMDRQDCKELISFRDRDMAKLKIMLEYLDGYFSLKNCIVIMTANHPEKLDPALVRPGRVDYQIHFNAPTNDDLLSIYNDAECKEHVALTLLTYRQRLVDTHA